MKAAIIGGGVIGGGWAARFLLNGWDVAIHDPDPKTEGKIGEVLDNARAALPCLSDMPMPPEGKLSFTGSIAAAVAGAHYIQESVGERLDLKHRVLAEIQAVAPAVPLGSSTSGFKPSQLQQGATSPEMIFVAHPFNPVYLLPLVELVSSTDTDTAAIDAAERILASLGMYPLKVRREIDAHIADRLLESVWREALWLVRDGIATTEEIDDAIRLGFGLRWAQMGLFETYRIAGGEAGMRHFLEQFGPCLEWPWSRLTDVPEYNAELVDLIAGQSDAQSGHLSIRELERIRDANLIGFMRVLKENDWGAGKVLLAHERRQAAAAPEPQLETTPAPLELCRMTVQPNWIDYNGHMTESRYLEVSSATCDAFLDLIGAGKDYVASRQSYFTAESHIRHIAEARQGDRLTGSVQVLGADEKRIHIFIRIAKAGVEIATIEQMLLHVDMQAGRACPASPEVLKNLNQIAQAHAALSRPEAAGRHVGQGTGT